MSPSKLVQDEGFQLLIQRARSAINVLSSSLLGTLGQTASSASAPLPPQQVAAVAAAKSQFPLVGVYLAQAPRVGTGGAVSPSLLPPYHPSGAVGTGAGAAIWVMRTLATD